MTPLNIGGFALAFMVFLVLLHLLLNRGRFEAKGFVLIVGYSLFTGLPVAYATMFAETIDLRLYGLAALVVAAPFVVLEASNLVKRRGSRLRSIAGLVGIVSMMSSPFFFPDLVWLPLLTGGAGLGGYLYFHFRYPQLNPMWLDAELREAAAGVPHDCGYSPKPVTVFMRNEALHFSGTFGCGIYTRRDRTIFWITKKAHNALGKPNLDLLARELARRICENTRKTEASK
jgi:hypothetical protein